MVEVVRLSTGINLLIGGRQAGKSHEILSICSKERFPIITGTEHSRRLLVDKLVNTHGIEKYEAENLVYTASKAQKIYSLNRTLQGGDKDTILIDDFETVLLILLDVHSPTKIHTIALQK